jgi:hypothetical protein
MTAHLDSMKPILRTNVVLGVVATSASALVWGTGGLVAAGVGAILACLNFWAITRLGRRAVERASGGATGGQAAALGIGLVLKMAGLMALVWAAVSVLKLAVLPFALGLSVFVVSILLAGTRLQADAQGVQPRSGDA